MATVLLVGTIVHSITFYLGVFKALRTFEISVHAFDFTVLNSTQAVTETILSMNNSSPHDFYALQITERVYVNDMFVGTVRLGGLRMSVPIHVPPNSSKNATIVLELDLMLLMPQLVELLLDPSSQKNWTLFVETYMEGPLVGKFAMRTFGGIGPS